MIRQIPTIAIPIARTRLIMRSPDVVSRLIVVGDSAVRNLKLRRRL
jgi:hypothetical protein